MLFVKCQLMTTVLLFLMHSCLPVVNPDFNTKVKLNKSAALSCPIQQDGSPGVIQWRRNEKPVAECGPEAKAEFQFTCRMDEGKNVLTVLQADSSNTGVYSVYFDGIEITDCRQFLQLLPPEYVFELKTGDHLKLDLPNRKTTIITVSKPGNSSLVEVCRVEDSAPLCPPEYRERVLVTGNVMKLLDMKPSDSGNYSVRERGQTLVSSSYVIVKDVPLKAGYWKGFCDGAIVFGMVMLVLGVLLYRFVVPQVINLIRKAVQRLRERNHTNINENVECKNGNFLLGDIPRDNMGSSINV